MKDKLMYEFARDEYKEQLGRRNEIRNRSSLFFGFGIPIVITLGLSCIRLENEVSCIKSILLVLAGLLAFTSAVFYLMIIIPSGQRTYYPSQLIKDIANLEDSKEIKSYLVSKSKNDSQNKHRYLAYSYFSNAYAEMFNLFEEKNKKFAIYFMLFSSFIFLALILLTIASIV